MTTTPVAVPDTAPVGPAWDALHGLPLAKGHGTENDFVLVPDADGRLALPPDLVASLCDRRRGIGGDGLIRLVRSAALAATEPAAAAAAASGAEWFMDYANADGSSAEMCGNGVRVFVAHLLRLGWLRLGDGEAVDVGTRAGVRRVVREGDWFRVGMGPWQARAAETVAVSAPGAEPDLPGMPVVVGNPHVVVALGEPEVLRRLDLAQPPRLSPLPSEGANVEFIVPGARLGEAGHVAMRVHERGVGETRSCGTGAVAAVLAARAWAGPGAPSSWFVEVPGGRLRVSVPGGARAPLEHGDDVELAGPATIVAEVRLD